MYSPTLTTVIKQFKTEKEANAFEDRLRNQYRVPEDDISAYYTIGTHLYTIEADVTERTARRIDPKNFS